MASGGTSDHWISAATLIASPRRVRKKRSVWPFLARIVSAARAASLRRRRRASSTASSVTARTPAWSTPASSGTWTRTPSASAISTGRDVRKHRPAAEPSMGRGSPSSSPSPARGDKILLPVVLEQDPHLAAPDPCDRVGEGRSDPVGRQRVGVVQEPAQQHLPEALRAVGVPVLVRSDGHPGPSRRAAQRFRPVPAGRSLGIAVRLPGCSAATRAAPHAVGSAPGQGSWEWGPVPLGGLLVASQDRAGSAAWAVSTVRWRRVPPPGAG
jgi:hypothetical protein